MTARHPRLLPAAAGLLLFSALAAGQAPGAPLFPLEIGDAEVGLDDDDAFGKSVADLGDLDGDGTGDMAVGANFDDDGAADAGAVWILLQDPGGTVRETRKISAAAGGFTGALDAGDHFGNALATVGDLDDDGIVDLAVAARRDDDGGFNRGAVWILFLNGDGTVREHAKISQTAGGFGGTLLDNGRFGSGLCALGDLDGDGVEDLAVGASEAAGAANGPGSVWILFLRTDGAVRSEVKLTTGLNGFAGVLDPEDHFGTALALLPDLDRDGVDDLAVGALWDDDGGEDTGATWILFLRADGTVKGHSKISATTGGFTGALDAFDLFGHSAACPGDLDLDGIPDLVVGAQGDDDGGPNRGAVWVLFLARDGSVRGHRKIASADLALADYDRFGRSTAIVADHDGNGFPDLAVGAPGDDGGGPARGAVWLFSLHGVPCNAALSADRATLSLAAGETQRFCLDAGPAFAGEPYLLLGSARGTAPGFRFGGRRIPLRPGPYLRATVGGTAPLVAAHGVLDGDGRAWAELVPATSLGAGTLHHAFLVLSPGSQGVPRVSASRVAFVSNAVRVDVLP